MASHSPGEEPGSVTTDIGSRYQEGTAIANYQEGAAMPNAVVMTGYGPPEVLKWAAVPLPEQGQGQIRIKVKAAGISPTDLALRAGYLKDNIPLPPGAVLGFEAAGTVDAVGPRVTGTSAGDEVTALLLGLGGYAEYAVASIWARKPESVSWLDAAALPSSAEAAAGVLRQLDVTSGETLLLFGGGALDETIALLADGRLRLRAHKSMPMQQAAQAHRQLESGTVHERIILTLP
jgi:NADPH:quinone reductase-like Zn-dependent oxidoreductase